MTFNEEQIDQLIKHYKYVAKSHNTHSQATCTVSELNKAIDETAKLVAKITQVISNN